MKSINNIGILKKNKIIISKILKLRQFYGFTFVELIISVTILAMFSIMGVASFQKFFSDNEMGNIRTRLINQIRTEENSLKSNKISSYKIIFELGAKTIFINENYYNSPYEIDFGSFDYLAISGSIVTNNVFTGTWMARVALDNAGFVSFSKYGTGNTLNFSLSGVSNFQELELNSSIDNNNTNLLYIKRIDYSYIEDTEHIKDSLISNLGGAQNYEKVILENRIGNKRLLASTGGVNYFEIDNAQLTIERGNQEISMMIEK